jgi:WD40 repeat protein
MVLSPSQPTLAVDVGDGVVLWDLNEPARPRRLSELPSDQATPMAFTTDGRTLATSRTSNDGSPLPGPVLWDLTDPAHPTGPVTVLKGHNRFVGSATVTPDQRVVAVDGDNGTVTLWDLTGPHHPGRLDTVLPGNTQYVSLVAFAPDQRTLVTDNADGEVLLWDIIELNDLIRNPVAQTCVIVEHGFDREEWGLRIPGIPYQDTCAT